MPRKSINEATLGLDIGYGVTKAVTTDSSIAFPSVMGHARTIKFQMDEIAAKYAGDQISDTDGDWFVGNLALAQLKPGEQLRLRGRSSSDEMLGNAFRLRLALAAIGKLFGDKVCDGDVLHLTLSTGLPVDHMPDSSALKSVLMGQHLIKTDSGNFVVNIHTVRVMPQPYGTIYSQQLLAGGSLNPHYSTNTTAVMDIGTYTVDAALDADGEYVDTASGSVESGVYTAQERIAATLEADYRQKPTLEQIEQVLRSGYVRSFGQPVDYRKERDDALKTLREAALSLAQEKWGQGMHIDSILITGGGAPYVIDDMRRAYRHAQMVEQSQMANAIGYLRYALFAAVNQ